MADQASEGLFSPFLQRQRITAVMPFLNGRVLDVGSGSGVLAQYVDAETYLGIERDQLSLDKARSNFPQHAFQSDLPPLGEKFDTIVTLAVIEHVANPGLFLKDIAARLDENELAHIVCTTPHPSMDWIHTVGSAIGLFSQHANDEHEDLLDFARLTSVGEEAGLELTNYKRFLMGANQLAVFQSIRGTS